MVTQAAATKFAAYDGKGIWGAGDTPEQARAEAEGFLRDKLAEDDPVLDIELAEIRVAAIGNELLDEVIRAGPGEFNHFQVAGDVIVPSDVPYDDEPADKAFGL